MKKFSAIIIAMAFVLGLSQCKKQETPTTTDANDGMVYITVNVGNNGEKHTVYPNHGLYAFDNGDILYVGNNGHYVGTLVYMNGAFSGGIQSPSTDDYLHFYFLGGKGPQSPTVGTESFTVNIADQTGNLPILSYGHSTAYYTNEYATYSTILRNQCALVKFSTNIASKTVKIAGMNTMANINFATGEITPNATTSTISFTTDSNGEGWAILLEQNAAADAAVTAVGYEDGTCYVPVITNNMYYTQGVSVNLTELSIVESGTKGSTSYVYYSDKTLYISGTGNVPGESYHYYYMRSIMTDVKKIVFDDRCTISSFDFMSIYSSASQPNLTDLEINTTVPLSICGGAIDFSTGRQVNITVSAPAITFPKHGNYTHPFRDQDGGSLNIVFNMSAPITFETYTFSSLTSADAVTIPAGCYYHHVGYQFTDSYVQQEYEEFVSMGREARFWDMYGYLVEGSDYIVIDTTEEITSSNASVAFGAATVTII